MSRSKNSKNRDDGYQVANLIPVAGKGNDAPTVESLISLTKVEAFVRTFSPCMDECVAMETFDDARLRAYFSAYYVAGVGDPLPLYLEMLEEKGFTMNTSFTTMLPCIFVRIRGEWHANETD